ncbi:MAG: hypothetical protein SH868_11875, partial [Bythopirellula sp.]|nr:hypothetical protein [Bythopirellula sp.]
HDGMLSVQTAVFTRCGANRVPLCGKSSGKSGLTLVHPIAMTLIVNLAKLRTSEQPALQIALPNLCCCPYDSDGDNRGIMISLT